MIFKCKMCGGSLEVEKGQTICECEYCGTKQTLPHLNDDKKANLYDRANHFRRNNDFDKAMAIYEQILNEDNTDAEAYWSLVLCRYGIEYVEDPSSHKRIPTVNRAQFTSVFDDDNYKSALRYADAAQREVYEEEAKAINEIQKGILAISQKEEPFDVFICYKEADSNGRRTQDSVLANDLYHQLKQEGFKVFFSRITLEDKLGSAYEPYIFAALNSAKVMVVLGTKPEYLNAVWVKNEWSRYLALVKQSNGKKILIPAYRDMDPYDLPEEFSHLQAQDMSKLGFMQDLIRGIKKIISVGSPKTAVKETVVINGGNSNTAPLLKRAFMFLEDGNWEEADEYCEKVLDQDPENAQAYLGKLMAELRVRKQEQLAECEETFEHNGNYQKALRFGSKDFQSTLKNIAEQNKLNTENLRLTEIYKNAIIEMDNASTENLYKFVAEKFKSISGFKDADELSRQCFENAEACRKDSIYDAATAKKNADKISISILKEAVVLFESVSGWKDSEEQAYACRKRIDEIKAKEEADRLEAQRKEEEATKKVRKICITVITSLFICCALTALLILVIIPNNKYKKALNLYNEEKYNEAIEMFKTLDGYKDSEDLIESCYIKKHGEDIYNKVKNANVGDTIMFGSYEQDNNFSNGPEPIEWIVINKNGASLLLISKFAIECHDYYTTSSSLTWKDSEIRNWLNNGFYYEAFSLDEQTTIQNTKLFTNRIYESGTSTTEDKVFLLSQNEAETYFSNSESRKCEPTVYMKKTIPPGLDEDPESTTVYWYLRSSASDQWCEAYVNYDGDIDYIPCEADCFIEIYVRPALWINLDI